MIEVINSLAGDANYCGIRGISVSALQENDICKQPYEFDKQNTFTLNVKNLEKKNCFGKTVARKS